MKKVTVFYAPDCPFSAATLAFLALRGADYRVVNLDRHPEDRARLAGRVDKLETPTLEVATRDGQTSVHVAPPLSELKALLEEWGLGKEAAPYEQLRG